MESTTQTCFFLSFLLYFIPTITNLSSAADTITSGQSLTVRETLISEGGNFELGYFNPGNSQNFYIGIWYKKISVQNRTYVWVANRDIPITTYPTSSELKLSEDGNLVLFNEWKVAIWSTNLISNPMNSSEAVLGDDGNLVLRNRIRPSDVFWQSFDYPTDTWLPGGRIRYDNRTKKSQLLTSWKNRNDPSQGFFSLELDPVGDQYSIRSVFNRKYWSSGTWDGSIFSGVPEMTTTSIFNFKFNYTKNVNESYFTYNTYNSSIVTRFVMDLSGQMKTLAWDETTQQWFPAWSIPRHQCEVYAFCGAYGVCNQNGLPSCRCVDGFEPGSPRDWNMSDFSSGGCMRKKPLQCGGTDAFSLIPNVSLPVNQQRLEVASDDGCRSACLKNCSCVAYSYNRGCSIWNGDLIQLSESDNGGGRGNLYLRLAPSPGVPEIHNSGPKGANIGVIVGAGAGAVAVAVAAALMLGSIVCYIGLKNKSNRKGNIIIINKSIASTTESGKDLELPLFDVVTIATSTDNFSFSNKIGQGGFGPVYKGVLPTGEEIAIKRLSKDSKQGLQEFMNEVVLIAKLQHRNLVKLLGCCIHGEENMLIYEYMPNKSLDFFIFDETRKINLNWNKRFNIIVGIARGLLYLHRDSRLRIIHRDLKASNVLLDNQMNPKISDFGMARTFGAEQTQENTMRVVGTYGYMSPEYATEGLFSMKSDVFSFGVLLLEIVSGKKNRGFHHVDHDLNLLGHTWKLLNENKALELVDASIKSSLRVSEVLKCIQVGLLCVQKFPEDRPGMSYVLSMLDGDGAMLPWPKQPGFYTERSPFEILPSLSIDRTFTRNEVTVTLPEGR